MFRLRPVRVTDARFILELRLNPLLSRFLHTVSGRLEDQEAWIRTYEARAGDWYWIVERQRDAHPEGTIGLYGLQEPHRRAEWGRWILRPGSLAAAESALLLYRAAFERLGLVKVFCRTLAENAQVLSFHDSCGLRRSGLLPAAFEINGKPAAAVEHQLASEDWPAVCAGLSAKAERLARAFRGGPE